MISTQDMVEWSFYFVEYFKVFINNYSRKDIYIRLTTMGGV